MRTNNIVKLGTVLVLAVIITGCCACRKGSKSALPLEGTQWYGVKVDNKYLDTEADYYTIRFEDGKVNGKGNCNRIMGTYTISDNKSLKIDGMASTRMLCPDQATEADFLKRLSDVDSYFVDGNTLMLLSKGETIFVFSPTRVK